LTFYLYGNTTNTTNHKGNNKIIKNRISSKQKKDLKILVEQFLEKDRASIIKLYQSSFNDSRLLFEQIYRILMRNTITADNLDVIDLTDEELKGAVLECHRLLTPIWRKFKKSIFDFKKNIFPEREKLIAANNALTDPSSPLYEYKDLQGYGYISMDKFYPLKLTKASTKINLSFDTGKVSIFRGDLNAVNSFLDLIRNVPVDLFSKCAYCKKVIVVSRKGKKYHSGCAAKAIQKDFWRKNKTVAKEKEKLRYQKRKEKMILKKENRNGEEK